jgi:hypothetical protein
VAGFGVGVEEVLDELAGVANDGEESDAGEEGGKGGGLAGEGWALAADVG